MNKILYTFAVIATLTSCASSYHVEGSSSVSALDGNKLYLRALKSGEVRNIDSCDVVHGEFHFAGLLDTVRMANLYMDDESIMPVVLEEGDIKIKIDNASQSVAGSPLNDMDGIDEETINQQLSVEAARIAQEEDSLVTNFIVDNFDNVLGPGVFMIITSQYRYPVLTPQIEDIMSKATKRFKNDPYVREYYQVAQENEQRMNGLSETAAPPADSVAPQTPTPLVNMPKP